MEAHNGFVHLCGPVATGHGCGGIYCGWRGSAAEAGGGGVAVGYHALDNTCSDKSAQVAELLQKVERWCRRIKAGSLKWCGQALYLG